MKDIDIARNVTLDKIVNVANKYSIPEEYIDLYGKYKAKISNDFIKKTEKNY